MHFASGGATPSSILRRTIIVSLLLLLCGLPRAVAEVDAVFRSRPDLYSPVLTLEHHVSHKLSPGYIFVGPYEADNSGPYIYDNEGNLVWSGWGNSGPGNAHGMHVCQYKGKDHLCFFQGIQQNGYCRGHGVIMDNQYRIVKTVTPGGGIASSDMHEFKPINDGKTALLTVYQQRQFDMSLWNVKTGMGWLMESIFQEVDVEANKVLFEWKSLDHVDPSASYTYPGATDTSGTGFEPRSPWDYFHINSVDKNKDGDYLISSRHTCAIYKISGRDGSIVWQLHGANPSFQNLNFGFSQQHDARWLGENGTHTLLSLYNNGYNGFNQTHTYSSGMTILINHVNNTAEQLRDYAPPGRDMLSSSQGNMQTLPNGNVFMGWGNNAYISEHSEAGDLLLWGYLDAEKHIMNYRAQKFQWDGMPTDVPALWAYSHSTDAFAATTLYVSWNGATRIRSWRFYGSMNRTGPYTPLKQVAKTGFETVYSEPHFYQWSYAEAVDLQGEVLGRSPPHFTFTPSPELQNYCGEELCDNAASYGVPGEDAAVAYVPPAGINTVPWVDPVNPHADNGDQQSSSGLISSETSPDGASAILKQTYHRLGWAGPALFVGIIVVGVFVTLRIYRRRRSLSQSYTTKERESSEMLDQERSRAMIAIGDWPWWHWRRWIGGQEPAHYFPLREPDPGTSR
ncbi:arylsulfotransferase family protein [Aspergillus affinis]|uniref:arylsulfotransferase family protein n=1 Tax=Aspergillus affinis TaxID=1070780 RepID=UPI0022FE919E|nr:MFS general substrate transporter [Aspergillus affinis]KAI9040820.1 MFS general substrate transporter [Aspergillus affinis]